MPEVKTLQGLNLESRYSIVKISLEGSNIGDISSILDKVASFHPLFLEEYTISEKEVSIKSKLPFIWRESANTFNMLSKSEVTREVAENYVVNTVLAKRIKSMSTIPLLYSAHENNIEVTPAVLDEIIGKDFKDGYSNIFNRYYVLGCGKGSQITGSIASTKDAYIAQKIQKDKWSTNVMIQRLNLPMPKWQVISSLEELQESWDKYEKPVVIKPTGLTGGHGVVVGVKTLEEAKSAFKFAKEAVSEKPRSEWQKKVMIQEQVQGEDYRLLVINGKLEIATKRIPAFITGDGKHTITELLEETNSDPRRDTTNPAHVLKPIVIDTPLKSLIKEQGYTLDSVPEKNTVVPVRKVASMSQGGITEDFTDKVGEEIRLIVETLAQSLHAFTLGVDVMCKDLSKPLTKENGAILEVNTMPESYLNFFPTIGTQRGYVANTYVKALLSSNKTKKFVVVGQSKDDIATLLRRKNVLGRSDIEENEVVGELKDGEYVINGLEINENTEYWRAVEAIKCNASLDVIIIHLRDWSEVAEKGLGFDSIDTLFVTKDLVSDKVNMKLMNKYKRMKLISNIKTF